jgi:EmrB/QacA subfamily drug resistance transporter
LVQYVDWRLIFYINVPIGILGSLAALAVFPRIHPTSWPRFDVWGFVTIAYGLFALLLAFSKAQDWGWTGYRIEILIVSGLLSLATFAVIELEVDHPLVDLRVFASWPFINSLVLLAITGVVMFSTMYYVPQFLQISQGMQAFNAGLVMMPAALLLIVLMPITGQLYDRIGARWPVVIGLLLMAYSQWLMADITPGVPQSKIVLWMAIGNMGIGLAMMPITTSGIASLPSTLTDSGSAMNNVVKQVSSSVSVAIFSSLLATWQAQMLAGRGALIPNSTNSPAFNATAGKGAAGLFGLYRQLRSYVTTESYANVFAVGAVLCAAGTLLALLLRSGPPQPATAQTTPTAPSPAAAPEPETVSVPQRSRHHDELPKLTATRRNQEAAHAAAGVHLHPDKVDISSG